MYHNLQTKIGAVMAALALGFVSPAVEAADTAKDLLKLTEGKRAKVVWVQGDKIKYFDTKEGKIEDLPFPTASQPLLTTDGLKVLCSAGPADDRSLMMYDTETKKMSTLTTGKYSGLLTVWRDPKTGRDWVYCNDAGSDGRNWDQPWGEMHRFPIDKPEEKEMCWNITTTHIYFMLSADGTRACFEPSWSNIGQLNLEYTSDGKIDQEKSVYKTVGGGCFPGLAPDNSYRLFRLDGAHKDINMTDVDGTNPRKISMTGMPGVGDQGKQIWLTRWSTHPRYISLMGPDSDQARIWMGRFDKDFTKIEEWVPVSEEGGPKCMQSHTWVEQEGTVAAGKSKAAGSGANASAEWPSAQGAVFALRDGNAVSPVVAFDDQGRKVMGFNLEALQRGLFGRFHELVCDGGYFRAPKVGAAIADQIAKSGAFTIEATITPAEVPPKAPGTVMTFANAKGADFELVQDKSGLSLRLPGNPPIQLFQLVAGKPNHVVILCSKEKWLAYHNGKPAGNGSLTATPPPWENRELLMGAGFDGVNPWHGRMEGIAIFPRALVRNDVMAQVTAIRASLSERKPAKRVRFQGTLIRQAVTSDVEKIRPYTRSLSVAEYKVDKVLSGEWTEPKISVMHWMVMDGKRLPIADQKPGTKVVLSVEPLDEHPQLDSSRRDEIEDADLDATLFYSESETTP